MEGLSRSDLVGVLGFAASVSEGCLDDTTALMSVATQIIGCDIVEYAHTVSFADEDWRVATDPGNFRTLPDLDVRPMDRDLQTAADANDPVRQHRLRTGSGRAVRLSDLVGDSVAYWRSRENVDVGDWLWSQYGGFYPFLLTARVRTPARRPAAISFVRSQHDFTARDLRVLDALLPFMAAHERGRLVGADTDDRGLTPRERQILDHVASGATNREIAQRLGVTPATVRTHLEHAFAKLEVSSRVAALAKTGRAKPRWPPSADPRHDGLSVDRRR